MNFRKTLGNAIIVFHVLVGSILIEAKSNSSEIVMLHRHLKKAKFSAAHTDRSRVLHLESTLDNFLDNGSPIKVSMQKDQIKIESDKKTRLINLPEHLRNKKGPYTLYVMEHGEHGKNGEPKQYHECQLPCTLQLQKNK